MVAEEVTAAGGRPNKHRGGDPHARTRKQIRGKKKDRWN